MCKDAIEPFAIVPTYAEDAEFGVRDGNFFITYLNTINGETTVVDRVIIPMTRLGAMRLKAGTALMASWAAMEDCAELMH